MGCMLCSAAIAKGSLKFTYAYKLAKPPRSIHAACAALIPKDLVGPSVSKLEQMLEQDLSQPARAACQEALQFFTAGWGPGSVEFMVAELKGSAFSLPPIPGASLCLH